jgi:hypothetical protein
MNTLKIGSRRLVLWFAAGSLLSIGSAYAQLLPIQLLDAQHSTYVSAYIQTNSYFETGISQSRTNVSSAPISDNLILYCDVGCYGPGNSCEAGATAGLFQVSGHTFGWTGGAHAFARATSQIRFSPLVDATQTINIQFLRDYQIYWTGGSVRLYDRTSDLEMWVYGWRIARSDPYSWTDSYHTAFTVETHFLASHQYELTLSTSMDSDADFEMARIQLAGLQVIPEPSASLLRLMAEVESSWPRPEPLRAALSAALDSIERGNFVSAINQLRAFQNKVRAQATRSDPAQAARFIQAAQGVIDVLRGDESSRGGQLTRVP